MLSAEQRKHCTNLPTAMVATQILALYAIAKNWKTPAIPPANNKGHSISPGTKCIYGGGGIKCFHCLLRPHKPLITWADPKQTSPPMLEAVTAVSATSVSGDMHTASCGNWCHQQPIRMSLDNSCLGLRTCCWMEFIFKAIILAPDFIINSDYYRNTILQVMWSSK